jgi:hypothetical protein
MPLRWGFIKRDGNAEGTVGEKLNGNNKCKVMYIDSDSGLLVLYKPRMRHQPVLELSKTSHKLVSQIIGYRNIHHSWAVL